MDRDFFIYKITIDESQPINIWEPLFYYPMLVVIRKHSQSFQVYLINEISNEKFMRKSFKKIDILKNIASNY